MRATLTVLAVSAAALPAACGDVRAVDVAAPATPRADASSAAPERAWVGPPWVLRSSSSTTWPAGAPSPYEFCGRAYAVRSPIGVREQTLVHPSGRQAHLLELSPDGEGPMQLFKFSYASCLVPGRAEGVGGPRNVWSQGAVAAGSEPVQAKLHVVAVTGPSADEPAGRDEAEALLDAWAS